MVNTLKRVALLFSLGLSLLTGCSSSRDRLSVEYGPDGRIVGWDLYYSRAEHAHSFYLIAWKAGKSWDTASITRNDSMHLSDPLEVWYRQEHMNCPIEIMAEILEVRERDESGNPIRVFLDIVDNPAKVYYDTLQYAFYDKVEYADDYEEVYRLLGLDL